MRKFTSLFMACMCLSVLAVHADECQFTPDLFPGQSADRTAYETSATVSVGEYGTYLMHQYSQVSDLTSTNQSVVTTSNSAGYDGVFFVGVGTADVTYTENWFTDGAEGGGAAGGVDGGGESGTSVCPSSHTIHYTVQKGTPAGGFAESVHTIIAGAGYSQPEFALYIKQLRTVNGYPQMVDMYVDISACTVTSSNEAVATIGRGNSINLPWPNVVGETTITATWAGDGNWNGVTTSCVIKVRNPLQDPELSFDATDVYAELGVPCTPPVFSNPHNVPINKWNSQNPEVANISEDGSQLTINGVGDAVIFCESFETDEYYAQSVSYTVHVSTLGIRVKGINVTSLNANDVLGDNLPSVTFDKLTRTLHFYAWNFDATGLNLDAIVKNESPEALYIRLHGSNSITNANICIQSEQSPVVIMGQGGLEELTLSGSQIGVNAYGFKVHQCAVDVEGTMAAMALADELSVSRGAHLLATSPGLAIQCRELMLADGEEGVDILTKNVRFEPYKGFLTSTNKQAKEVEIGKVAVVVSADEVTEIDFTATDPEGHESVIFSASAGDAYNAETGQIELSTSLTDEAVAEALESLVPGSSAWIGLLPGSIVIDVPAGAGELQIECLTLLGYTLQVKMEGASVVSISQTTIGWATVTYNVPSAVHVVIYLHADSSASAPARIATRMEDAITAGAYIKAVKIIPANAPTDIQSISTENEGTRKVMHDGQLYIIRDGKAFNAQGAMMK